MLDFVIYGTFPIVLCNEFDLRVTNVVAMNV